MPIIVPESHDPNLINRLQAAEVPVISEAAALRQDIRPARIGLLNLMPEAAMDATEIQWLRWIGTTGLQIEPVLIKFDEDRRENPGSSRKTILERYTPFSKVKDEGIIDGLIVTGDNLELLRHARGHEEDEHGVLPVEEIDYYHQLTEVFDWADRNVYSTFFSCFSTHMAIRHRWGIDREVRTLDEGKVFGVYAHSIDDTESKLVTGMSDLIYAPHSRWGYVPTQKIIDEKDMKLVISNDEIGWLAAEAANAKGGTDVYVQGHPEYYRLDLHNEYVRDRGRGFSGRIPANYYQHDEPDMKKVVYLGTSDGRVLHLNWLDSMVMPGFSEAV